MPIEIWNARGLLVATLMLGCPAGDDGSAGTEGDTDASTGTTAATAATSPTSAASMSSTSASTGTTEPETSGSEVTGDVSTGTTAPAESSSGGSSGTTGALDPCAALGRDECAADETCEPIACAGYMMTGAGTAKWCLDEPMFIGCRSADLDCTMEPTVTCEGDDAPIYRCREDCVPEGFILCDPPVDGDVPGCE